MSEASIRKANQLAHKHGIDLSKLPKSLDLTVDNITEVVHVANANCQDERLKFIFKSLVNHLHDFARETSMTTEEWVSAIDFLNNTTRKGADIREESILVLGVLGLLTLDETLNNPTVPGATEGSLLGPFFATNAIEFQNGESIASEGKGEYLWVEGKVLDTKGNPIANCAIDTWETDGDGLYDVQYDAEGTTDCRGRLHTAEDGSYCYRAVVPVSYPIPGDGTAGQIAKALGRHLFRPAHLHMVLEARGFEKLVTALYLKGDPYLTSDVTFGVKSSLVVEATTETDPEVARKRGFKEAKEHQVARYDFVLATAEEAKEAKRRAARLV
ncbi:hydroxyquinol 1,2-dioxygenase [Favolaschia claudopus]|uniref:Hydroxyquinol 1,2-dioxygenase n=1 Tax=Favolaschia claudopus TaxID=2862362 RepID=A0AAW0DJF2_9AGAR